MAWTTSKTWLVQDALSVTDYNNYMSGNMQYIYDAALVQPCVLVYKTAQFSATANTDQAANFNASSTVAVNRGVTFPTGGTDWTKITITRTGRYHLGGANTFLQSATADIVRTQVIVNTTAVLQKDKVIPTTVNGGMTLGVSRHWKLSSGDTVSLISRTQSVRTVGSTGNPYGQRLFLVFLGD